MKKLIVLLCLLTAVGCSSKPMNVEQTIHTYYEHLLDGNMEKATELLDWDSNEGDIIHYFANLNQLSEQYKLISYEGLEIITINISDEKLADAEVKLIYLDESNQKRVETNFITLKKDSKEKWMITSINKPH